MYKIKFYTRSFNVELFVKSSQLFRDLGYPVVRLTDKSADGYFYAILHDMDCDVAINVDEDCFIANPQAVIELAKFVVENGYANAGCQDSGKPCPRGGNPIITNPFFNILNLTLIREKFSIQAVKDFVYSDHKQQMIDNFSGQPLDGAYNFDADCLEPYYPFFLWLAFNFKTLYLPAKRHDDGLTTILFDNHHNLIAEHTWYARFYTLPSFLVKFAQKNKSKQKQRIDNIITEVYAIREMQIPKVNGLRVLADRVVRWSIKIPQRIAGWPRKLKKKLLKTT